MTAISFPTPITAPSFIRRATTVLRISAIIAGLTLTAIGGLWYSIGQTEESSAQMDSRQ